MWLWKRFYENQIYFWWWLTIGQTIKISYDDYNIRSIFEEDGKLYPQVFLDDALYEWSI